jgi:hypothetical protein
MSSVGLRGRGWRWRIIMGGERERSEMCGEAVRLENIHMGIELCLQAFQVRLFVCSSLADSLRAALRDELG